MKIRQDRIGAAMVSATLYWGMLFAPSPALAGDQEARSEAWQAQRARSIADAEARAAVLVTQMTLAEKAAQIRDEAPAIDRLGIPAYNYWSEGLHGVARAGEATVFPQAIGMAATFDPSLIRKTADVIATEFRAKYLAARGADGSSVRYRGLNVWSPNVNIFRDPRWGRGQETWGEDPFLTSEMGVSFIRGLQGDDPASLKTLATVKHFAVHSGPESARHHEDVAPSPRDLEETYLPAFRAAVQQGAVDGLMCAYNAIAGIPACATPLMEERVRGDWGFAGQVVSDCAAIADFVLPTSHHWKRTAEEAVAAALNAGTDLFCLEFGFDKTKDPAIIARSVAQGYLDEAVLDRAIIRLLAGRIRLGLLASDGTGPYAGISADQFDTAEHRDLAREVARASLVLLKNDGLLPLRGAPRKIAVIGPNADSVDALVGNYNGTPSTPVTVVEGLRQRFPDAQVTLVEGTGLIGPAFQQLPESAFCLDMHCRKNGVRREVFSAPDMADPAEDVTVQSEPGYEWGQQQRIERDGAVRWSGWIRPETSGEYRFQVDSLDGSRVTIAGQTIVDLWNPAEPADSVERSITLTAGKAVPFVFEARQVGNRGRQGISWAPPQSSSASAIAAAREADLVVFAGGLTARLEGEEMRVNAEGFAGGDRTSLDLPAPQRELLEKLHATGKPVVFVLMSGSAVSINWADEHIPAIVQAWYPGGEGGRAIAELIAGDFSPSGRLPVTFYRSARDLPPFDDYAMDGRTYRYFFGEVLYPFGHGLSFTEFAYDGLRLGRSTIRTNAFADVSVEVRNAGKTFGTEVIQLYVSHGAQGGPIRSLKAIQRVSLEPGESRRVSFRLDAEALAQVQQDGSRVVAPGGVEIWIGGGQPLSRPGLARPAGQAAKMRLVGKVVTLPK